MSLTPLNSLQDIASYWKLNTTPIYFISPTPFNLIGMEQWIGAWTHVNFVDLFDGKAPNTLIPSKTESPVFESMESLNHYLLSHFDFIKKLQADRQNLPPTSPQSRAVFLFFDEAIETLCHELDLDIYFPKDAIRRRFDSKIITTQLGNHVGVPSVPNVLAKIESYATLVSLAEQHHLGTEWVIQTAYGDSGKTTFFIGSEADYDLYSEEIESQSEVKIMKRIQCLGTAIEGCATRCGTFVGPLMTELIGDARLTPYPGGWCGNDLSEGLLSPDLRKRAQVMTQKLGDALYQEGYRGYFEVDYLLDSETGELYLGEMNPRISGVTAMTSRSAFCQNTLPLFLLHLTEFSDIPFSIDPYEFNQKALTHPLTGQSQLIFKYTPDPLQILIDAPQSGRYTLTEGALRLMADTDPPTSDEAFLLRIMSEGNYVYHGADLAIVFLNTPLMTPSGDTTARASEWITAIKNAFISRELTEDETIQVHRYHNPGVTFKGMGANE